MTVYILLFRGVGGATQLPTKPLREKLTEAGFENVATYINSGNAVLRSRKGRAAMLKEVAAVCKREFGFDKDIHAPTLEELSAVIARNPWPDVSGKFLHAAWLAAEPDAKAVEALKAVCTGGEKFEVIGNIAYIHTPDGFGTSKLAIKFDKGIGVPNTARNWNTVLKMKELAEKAAG